MKTAERLRFKTVDGGTLPQTVEFDTVLEEEAQRLSVGRTAVQMVCERQGLLKGGQKIYWRYPYERYGRSDIGKLPDGRKVSFTLAEQCGFLEVPNDLPKKIPWEPVPVGRSTPHTELTYRMELSLE